jgi:hypothetical protein
MSKCNNGGGGCARCVNPDRSGAQCAEYSACAGTGTCDTGCSGCQSGGCASGGCKAGGCACPRREIVITEGERDFLLLLGQLAFLPLARIMAINEQTGQPEPVEPVPFYLSARDDALAAVQEAGTSLLALEEKRLVTLDYDKPLVNGDYSIFESSGVYQDALRTHGQRGYGPPSLEYGSAALTTLGQSALDGLDRVDRNA